MASFLILVHSPAYASQSSLSALKFAEAVVRQGHQLKAVFFYQQGVDHANSLTTVPADELQTISGFKVLNQAHQVPLLLCVTAGEKRGILGKEQADIEGFEQHNADPAFTVAGLAEMAAISAEVDRVIQFK